jgi:hypothetical protein
MLAELFRWLGAGTPTADIQAAHGLTRREVRDLLAGMGAAYHDLARARRLVRTAISLRRPGLASEGILVAGGRVELRVCLGQSTKWKAP